MLPGNPFNITSGSTTITVTEPSHGRSTQTQLFLEMLMDRQGVLLYAFENSSDLV